MRARADAEALEARAHAAEAAEAGLASELRAAEAAGAELDAAHAKCAALEERLSELRAEQVRPTCSGASESTQCRVLVTRTRQRSDPLCGRLLSSCPCGLLHPAHINDWQLWVNESAVDMQACAECQIWHPIWNLPCGKRKRLSFALRVACCHLLHLNCASPICASPICPWVHRLMVDPVK